MFVDLKAPRFNSRTYRKQIVSKDLWREWKAKTGRKISFERFRDIWDAIAEKLKDNVIEERDGIRIQGIGDMYMGYVPGSSRKVDYKLSIEHGKTIYHENWHTAGRCGKLVYATRRRPYMVRRYYLWAFDPCREFKRRVGSAFHENPDRYKVSLERYPKLPYNFYFKDNDDSFRDDIQGEDQIEVS